VDAGRRGPPCQARGAGRRHQRGPSWAQLADHALSAFVEPTILYDYPVELSPFARATDDDPTIVERFEYFVGGMELGNAFSEINDPDEQAERSPSRRKRWAESRETPTTSRRSPTGCRPRAASASESTGSRWSSRARDTIRDVILFPALRAR
jgi:lysyl-tRNA synthetase, class II